MLTSTRTFLLATAALFAVGLYATACGNTGQTLRTVALDTFSCASGDAKEVARETLPLVESAIELATGSDGVIDTAKLRESARGLKSKLLQCAFESGVKHVLTAAISRIANPNAPQSEGLVVDPNSLARAYAEIHGDTFGGTKFEAADL